MKFIKKFIENYKHFQSIQMIDDVGHTDGEGRCQRRAAGRALQRSGLQQGSVRVPVPEVRRHLLPEQCHSPVLEEAAEDVAAVPADPGRSAGEIRAFPRSLICQN